MSTTSLKLPDDLKELAAAAASDQGISLHAFMVEALKDAPVENFDPPPGVQFVDVCQASGAPPLGPCSKIVKEVFIAGQIPPPAAEPTSTALPSPTVDRTATAAASASGGPRTRRPRTSMEGFSSAGWLRERPPTVSTTRVPRSSSARCRPSPG